MEQTEPNRPRPNCRCRDCGAALFFQAPEVRQPMVDTVNWLADRWWARAILIAIGFVLGVTVSWWALGILLFIAFFLYLVKPPSYKPRCPKCKSLDIVEIILPLER